MYKNWKVENWETPVSRAHSLLMVSLLDDCKRLSIILQDVRDPTRRRFRFSFSNYPVYRNILEEYRLEIWVQMQEQRKEKELGWTLIVPGSQWLRSFKENEPLLELHNPNLVHYMICTENDVIEVLSNAAPEILEIEPAGENEELAGKSIVFYSPGDRDKIEPIFDEIKKLTREDP
jgi:hypothetical protein